MSAWKHIARLFVAAVLLHGPCGCESESSEAETAISGNSRLVVVNDSGSVARVVFDHEYIGSVPAMATRSWNVPTGPHRVTVGGNGEDMDFPAGASITVKYEIHRS